ncbi:hypothetical protein [Streptomyces sp. G1]|uniref:hypothetical protein n=1 Tax=Streptomyces sp. G1 TaxID=361572 RepID=UPI00202E3F31|nr:hypothetical protein [Streptomyces sp. G1]MCM1965102.1 hypothetical protein [Streptomyces sp. G1]
MSGTSSNVTGGLTLVMPPTDATVFALIVHKGQDGAVSSVLVDGGCQRADDVVAAKELLKSILAEHSVSAPDHIVVTTPAACHSNLLPTLLPAHGPKVRYAGSFMAYPDPVREWFHTVEATGFPRMHSDLANPMAMMGAARVYVVVANGANSASTVDHRSNAAIVLVTSEAQGVLLLGDASGTAASHFVARMKARPRDPAAVSVTSPGALLVHGHPTAGALTAWPWAPHSEFMRQAQYLPLGEDMEDEGEGGDQLTGPGSFSADPHDSRILLLSTPVTGGDPRGVQVTVDHGSSSITLTTVG